MSCVPVAAGRWPNELGFRTDLALTTDVDRRKADGDRLCVSARFCGPPDVANGGYLAGLVAGDSHGPVQVTLRRPVPLETDLTTRADGHTTRVFSQDELLAEAVPGRVDLDVPPPPDFDEATRASAGYIAFDDHPFPRCFVCGTGRIAGDGLRIFAGPVSDRSLVAAPWVPDVSLATKDGAIRAAVVWAALDCPGAFADTLDRNPAARVLGRITAERFHAVHAGERHVVMGWPVSRDGRKHHVGTAIVDSKGRVCAAARATWFDMEVTPQSRAGHPA